MTPLLFALAAAAAPAPLPTTKTCIDLVRTAPDRAVAVADGWRAKGGGLDAMQCGALALSALERWSEAGVAFEAAALEATRVQDLRAADYWVQAGNAWLAGGDASKAKKDLDTALASTALSPKLRGEAHLDRARAAVAAGDAAAARSDIDRALTLVAADPFAWYLSAALARRQNDLPRAKADISKALTLAAGDAQLLVEAGNIAGAGGDAEGAHAYFARAAKASPTSDAGRAAAAALAADTDPAAPAAAPK